MPRGGNRKAQAEAAGKKVGRPRIHAEESTPRVDKGFAARVMSLIGKPDWTKITRETAKNAEEYALTFLTGQNVELAQRFFDKLLDRRFGKPPQPVFNADTRENSPELDFGDLPMPAGPESGNAGKPN